MPTHTQLADLFTKALGAKKFGAILLKLGIQDLHAPNRTKSLLDLIRLNYRNIITINESLIRLNYRNIITINGSIISLNYRCYIRKRICTVLMLWLYIYIYIYISLLQMKDRLNKTENILSINSQPHLSSIIEMSIRVRARLQNRDIKI